MTAKSRETRDVTPPAYAALAGAYAALVIAAAAVAYGAQHWLLRGVSRADAGLPVVQNVLPPQPRLEADNEDELRALRAREDDLLSHYRWIDRRRGIARIPIERAIALALARGFPVQERRRP